MDHNLILYGPGISEPAELAFVPRFVAGLMSHNLVLYGSGVWGRGT